MKLTSRFLFIALFSIGLAPMLQGQNLYPYRKDSLWGYCDSSKHIVIPIQYNSASIFSYCGIATVKINGKYRFIDKSGKYINDIEYDGWSFFWANKTYVWLDDKYGLIDSAGNEVIPAIYDDVNYTTDILAFKKEDNWALFDYNSGKRTTGFKYQDIVIRSYKLKGVKIKDKWGFVNRKGRLKIKPKFDEIDGFSKEGLCAVRQGKKWGFVNLKGKVVGKFDYSQVYSYQTEGAWVKKDSKWGLIDTKGEVVIPFLYSDISYFKEGLAFVYDTLIGFNLKKEIKLIGILDRRQKHQVRFLKPL